MIDQIMADMAPANRAVHGIVGEMRGRMPSVPDMVSILEKKVMGPDVSIPAIWLHLLFLRLETLEMESYARVLEGNVVHGPWAGTG